MSRSLVQYDIIQNQPNRLSLCCASRIFAVGNLPSPSRDNLETCSQRRLQRQSPLWDRHLIRGVDLFHDPLDKEVEDLEFMVEGFDELLIGLNPHDNLWKHVVPADDIDPASLGNVELTLQLRPEAFIERSGNPVFDLSVR